MNETLMIASAIVGVLTVIVILFVRQGKKQAAQKRGMLMDAAQKVIDQQHLQIEHQDLLHNRIIAIDPKRKTLVFADWQNEIPHVVSIDITGITQCNLQRIGNKITEKLKNGKKSSEEHVTELQLECVSKNGTMHLVMYKEMIDGILEKQILTDVANKWKQRIDELRK